MIVAEKTALLPYVAMFCIAMFCVVNEQPMDPAHGCDSAFFHQYWEYFYLV